MRLNHFLFVIFMTFLFAGSATSASSDTPFYDKITFCDVDLQENSEGENDSPTDAFIRSFTHYGCATRSSKLSTLSNPVCENRLRLVSYPILPQAPPVNV